MLINLHSHLEGRLRARTAAELAPGLEADHLARRSAGGGDPAGGESYWAQALQLRGPSDLPTFLTTVAASYPFFRNADNLSRIACEAVEDAAADGQDYLELRFGPATHVSPLLSIDDVVRAVCAGVAEGSRRSGLAAGVVVAALRTDDADTNRTVAEVAARFAGAGVVGFDLAGDEFNFPSVRPYVQAFGIARAAGLGLTCHAAEAAPARAARSAVELLGVSRIGHGAHVADDPDVLAWMADSGVALEVCPTSNWYTGAIADVRDHPVPKFVEAGVNVVLGDDNPTQIQSQLSAEYALLTNTFGFTGTQLAAVDQASIRVAFLDDTTRKELIRRSHGRAT